MPSPSELERGDNPARGATRYAVGMLAALSVSLAAWVPLTEPPHSESPHLAAPRSSHWPVVRAEHLKSHPCCEVCGGKSDLEVHHCVPHHRDPSKELDPANLITLCRHDHFHVGHAGNFRASNPKVREDAKRIREILERAKREREED